MIGADYKEQLNVMHSQGMFNNGLASYKLVRRILSRAMPDSVLDFGCGHGALIEVIRQNHPSLIVDGYDPGNPKFDVLPAQPSDVLLSTDVLEHVEPEHIDATLLKMAALFRKYGFFRIACYPAVKRLPDGRNAHLIVESPNWWRQKIMQNNQLQLVREKITRVDKRHKHEGVYGFNFDVIVQKRAFVEDRPSVRFALKYGWRL